MRVRVLLDASMAGVAGSCIGQLRRNNVCVRVYAAPAGGMLHHKFAVCDARGAIIVYVALYCNTNLPFVMVEV